MLKIVEMHASERPNCEYVVLQNLGLVTVNLRGWAICTDAYLERDIERMANQMYVFRTEAGIKPYTRVVLFTGQGEDGWLPTVDGRQAYCAYWNRSTTIWTDARHVHVLQMHATQPVHHPHTVHTAASH